MNQDIDRRPVDGAPSECENASDYEIDLANSDIKDFGRVMIVGPTGAGKSSLLHALGLTDRPAIKTEQVLFGAKSIDTPGEMLEIPRLYHALIINSAKAELVLFVADPTRRCSFPAKMAKALRAPVLGVVTKTDIASPEAIARAHKALDRAGVKEVVETSVVNGSGLKALMDKGHSLRFNKLLKI